MSYKGTFGPDDQSRYAWKRWTMEVLANAVEELVVHAGATTFAEALGRRPGPETRVWQPGEVIDLLSRYWAVGDEVYAGLRLGRAAETFPPGTGAIELFFDDAEGAQRSSVVLVPRLQGAGPKTGGAHVVVAERAGLVDDRTDSLEALVGFALELLDSDEVDWRMGGAAPRADTFCVLPWTMLDVKPQGHVMPCDLFGRGLVADDGEAIDVRRHSLASAWKSADIERVRRAHAAGQRIPECDRCWRVEEEGGTSRRLRYLDELAQFVPLAQAGRAQLAFISLFPGNLCNLRCRTCGPGSSSALIREVAEVDKLVTLRGGQPGPPRPHVQENWLRDNTLFLESVDEVLPGLKLLEFLGGEPLLINEHQDLLRRLVDSGHAAHVELRYVTNGTRLPPGVVELWPHFERVGLQVSLDGVGRRFEYLRRPAKWDAVVRNIDRFREIAERVDVTTNATFSLLSGYYVNELFEWCHGRGLKCSLNPFGEPRHLDPRSLTPEAKRAVRQRVEDAWENIQPSEHSNVDGLLDLMDSEDWSVEQLPTFWLHTRAHDDYNGDSFEEAFPELAALLAEHEPK